MIRRASWCVAAMPKRGGEDDVGVDKSWILAHVEKEAQAEQEARQVAKVSHVRALRPDDVVHGC